MSLLEIAAETEPLPLFALTRPLHVGRVHLRVVDIDRSVAFYNAVMGLAVIERTASGAVLGTLDRPLLTLSTAVGLRQGSGHAAGLYHTAFLVPDRPSLAQWLAHVVALGIPLDGASDHLVSEAIYLTDPEGNGIEIYRDRPPREWSFENDGSVSMATLGLDLQDLYDSAPAEPWRGMPSQSAIGHIHLQVGDVASADRFFGTALGLTRMASYPGASFYATGRYHHHIAANVWRSRGAGVRPADLAGLAEYSLIFHDPDTLAFALKTLERMEIPVARDGDGHRLQDPWGIGLILTPAG